MSARRLLSTLGLGLALLAALLMLVGLVLGLWAYQAGLPAVERALDAATPYLAAWRLLVFLILIGDWPRWIDSAARRRRWPEAKRQAAMALRWRAAAWFLVIEALFVQNVGGEFAWNWLLPAEEGP
ncbi:hypothetical protein ACWJKU_08995 [Methylocaldum sp. MU1018]